MRIITFIFVLLSACSAMAGPSLTSQTPVSNFRLPTFTKEGFRSMLLQGSQAIVRPNNIEFADLNLTLFSGDEKADVVTVLLSPNATA